MAKYRVLSEIERDGTVYIPADQQEPNTAVERRETVRVGDGCDVRIIKLKVDRSLFELTDDEAAQLLAAGVISPLKKKAAPVDNRHPADIVRERSLERVSRFQKEIDRKHAA